MTEEDNTWGDDEENIIAGVQAHREWFDENYEAIVKADAERVKYLEDVGFTSSAHSQLPDITADMEYAEGYVQRYQELGEDKERNGQRDDGTPTYTTGHLRYGAFASLNNFRVRVGHRLGMKEVFDLPKW